MRFGYADPPYPGKSGVYRDHPDYAGRHVCFVMEAAGRRQVERCVRCGVQLHARSTEDCTPAAGAGAAVRAMPVAEARAA